MNAEPLAATRCVVRLTTTVWHDASGLTYQRRLRYLKKQCSGHNLLDYDADMVGARETADSISNLHECADGIYSVVTCNERRDFETGLIDDYDLKLIPYAKPE